MPKGQFVRRTIEQQLEDALAKVAAIEAKIKAKNELSADHKAIKAIVTDIGKVAKDLNVADKDILKLVASVIAPRKARSAKAEG